MKPFEMKTTLKEIQIFAAHLRGEVYRTHEELGIEIAATNEPVLFADRLQLAYRPFRVGERWSDQLFSCGWMHITGKCPPEKRGRERVLIIDVSGEGCLFDSSGTPVRGLTNVASMFDRRYGLPGKTTLFLDEMETAADAVDAWIEIGNNDLFGASSGGIILQCHTGYLNTELRNYYYDLVFLLDYLEAIDDKNPQYYSILYAMQESMAAVSGGCADEEIAKARDILSVQTEKRNGEDTFLSFSAIGHAHLDLAWLWPLRETKRKLGRTFANAVANMGRYGDFRFGASQAQQFAWLEELYPKLFEKVKAKVAEGRMELQGGMWVEPDTNLSGGEALIRQVLYGKRYFLDKFGKDIKICWLPDAFGFSGALPQILKKCGMDYFLTIKLSWSEHFEFPHHTFRWEGIDGSEVLVHMPPEGTYNSSGSPKALLAAQANFAERGKLPNALMLYGIGDGGGGPGRDHLERVRRAKNFAGLPQVEQRFAEDFFRQIEKDTSRLAVWKGEMYLDRHQGTLTSAGQNKKYNRLLENALLAYEKAAVIAGLFGSHRFNRSQTDRIWKEVLLYQFHDILPGSAIKRVYDESVPRYREMLAELTGSFEEAAGSLSTAVPCAYNANSFAIDAYTEYQDKVYRVSAEPLAFTELKEIVEKFVVSAEENALENAYLRAEFDAEGWVVRLYDKENNTESLRLGNELKIYHEFLDCWDMSANFKKYYAGSMKRIKARSYVKRNRAVLEQEFIYGNSRLTQKVVLENDSRILDFQCSVDWRETREMLRVEFEPCMKADTAVCDIQFGYLERPVYSSTVEQFGKYEVSMHKYVDLSTRQYGVAVLNDGKYAVNVKDGLISVNLLRSQMYPCVDCDKGKHEFSYALYPHSGDVVSSKVITEATAYNRPLKVCMASPTKPLMTSDNDGVLIESVKFAEKTDDIIVRIYESKKLSAKSILKFGFPVETVFETDMLENEIREICRNGNEIELQFAPFEIKTLKVIRS